MNNDTEFLDIDIMDGSSSTKNDDVNSNKEEQNGEDDNDKRKKVVNDKPRKKYKRRENGNSINYVSFAEKGNLTREERKNLMAMRLFAKMEQVDIKKTDDIIKKKRKIDSENTEDILNIENNIGSFNKLEQDIPKTEQNNQSIQANKPDGQKITKQTSKKADPASLSQYLNPDFDLKNHSSLLSFIFEYQKEQLNRRKKVKENAMSASPNLSISQKNPSQNSVSPSTENEIILDEQKDILIHNEKLKIESYREQCDCIMDKLQAYAKIIPTIIPNQVNLPELISSFISNTPK